MLDKGLAFTIGRFLYGIPITVFGILHLISGPDMAAMVPIPGGVFWVYLTGVALIAAGVSILIQKKTYLATQLLAILILSFAIGVHLLNLIGGDAMSMGQVLKDTAIVGGALLLAGIHHPINDA